ncbi:MAG: hypothetical protein HPY82_05780 [Gammaproteobacteria bacterium]|nr:hypothetical protein [Gammaproteobacteria bacterium]
MVDQDTAAKIEKMKEELKEMCRSDVLVRDCRNIARFAGLSEADFYLLLAYHAVKEKQKLAKVIENSIINMTNPPPIFISTERARELGIAPAS